MSYRIRNWSEYTAGLKQRGSLTFWLDEAVLSSWLVEAASSGRGATQTYSDIAIATFETIKAVYRQAGRQTEGLLYCRRLGDGQKAYRILRSHQS